MIFGKLKEFHTRDKINEEIENLVKYLNSIDNLCLEFNTDGSDDEFGSKFIKGVVRVIKVWPDEIYFDNRFDTVTLPFYGVTIENDDIHISLDEVYPSNVDINVYDIINMVSKGAFNIISEDEFENKFIKQMYETANMVKDICQN